MTAFWIVAGLMLVLALAFVVPPLLRRPKEVASPVQLDTTLDIHRRALAELDADRLAGRVDAAQYERSRTEIERRVLEEAGELAPPARMTGRWVAFPVAVLVPALAAGVYLTLGSPQATSTEAPRQETAGTITPEQVEQMVAQLAQRMEQEPDNAEGWAMLARSYLALQRYPEAVDAFSRLVRLKQDEPDIWVDYADAIAMTRGRNLSGDPEKMLHRALGLQPDHPKALALAGSAAMQRRDAAAAILHWQKLLAVLPPESALVQPIRDGLAEAEAMRAGKSGEGGAVVAMQRARVSGTVSLAPEFARAFPPETAVFVFARAVEGPRAPLAVLRMKVGDLPAKFELTDDMAMNPARKLSSAGRLIVGARVSPSGSPMPSQGDVEGFSSEVGARDSSVELVISRPWKP